ncbi:MAG TPA: malto-oligosyltrehalose trehalohydrolase [Flavisolibacter sp.]
MRGGIDTGARSVGVFFKEGGAAARVWAPLAKKVAFVITATGQRVPLQKSDMGYWDGASLALQPGDLYQFIVDDNAPLADPVSLSQPQGVHGPSEALDLSHFAWKDDSWENPALEQYIIYELHAGTFTEEGTFAALQTKLDYLVELGINAIEIMPVAQFPGDRNWGYDGVYPFAVQNSYGGPGALQALVDACHEKGLAVILDVVYNHLGPEGAYHSSYGPYFTDKYKTPWGRAVNFDDEWCDGVRDYFVENALMWFRDFHIDALRLDAVHAIKDFSPVHLLEEIRQATDSLMKSTGRKHYLIVESDLNDTRFIDPLQQRGFGMDAQWVDEFHHALRTAVGESRTGYYSDFNGIEHVAKAYSDAYVYDGQFSPHRKKTFGVKTTGRPGKNFIVFSQNHDQVGNRMLGDRTSTIVSFELQKVLAGAVLMSPFIPMLFMGEEWSEPNPFQYFVSHTDPELAEAVRKGRKEEFAAFHLEGEAPDPVDTATFQNSKLQWGLHKQSTHALMFRYYQELIRLRKSHPALVSLDREKVRVEKDMERGLITLQRDHEDGILLVFLNFSGKEVSVSPPRNHEWKCLLASSAETWGGPGFDLAEDTTNPTLKPESLTIYTTKHV